jgi:hypothetical protein
LSEDAPAVAAEPAEEPAPPPVCATAAEPASSASNTIAAIDFAVIEFRILLLPFQRKTHHGAGG